MTATLIPLPPVEAWLRLEPAFGAELTLLRTAGRHDVAMVPSSVQIGPKQAARLFLAWLQAGRTLHWQETAQILAEEGAAA